MVEKKYFSHETAIIDEGCKIGANTKIWHFSHLMTKSVIGQNCNIGQNVVISPEVILGSNVKVQNNVSIYTGVICEDDVFLGPSMVFTNVINPRSAVNRKEEFLKTIVKKGASIGANATIVCGNSIGKFSFIGAGSVVTKEIPNFALVVGNPSRQIGWVGEFGHRLIFDSNNIATCNESKQEYKLENNIVTRIS
jgi:UDP-2-acetamido-3-amino-2,3-dideoxy-glucuronate N-acetyltransferase